MHRFIALATLRPGRGDLQLARLHCAGDARARRLPEPGLHAVTAFILHADGRISGLPVTKIAERIIRGFGLSA